MRASRNSAGEDFGGVRQRWPQVLESSSIYTYGNCYFCCTKEVSTRLLAAVCGGLPLLNIGCDEEEKCCRFWSNCSSFIRFFPIVYITFIGLWILRCDNCNFGIRNKKRFVTAKLEPIKLRTRTNTCFALASRKNLKVIISHTIRPV